MIWLMTKQCYYWQGQIQSPVNTNKNYKKLMYFSEIRVLTEKPFEDFRRKKYNTILAYIKQFRGVQGPPNTTRQSGKILCKL